MLSMDVWQRQSSVLMCWRFPEITLGLFSCLCTVKADVVMKISCPFWVYQTVWLLLQPGFSRGETRWKGCTMQASICERVFSIFQSVMLFFVAATNRKHFSFLFLIFFKLIFFSALLIKQGNSLSSFELWKVLFQQHFKLLYGMHLEFSFFFTVYSFVLLLQQYCCFYSSQA